jgi:DNA-binding MarR family transcriptional regulator
MDNKVATDGGGGPSIDGDAEIVQVAIRVLTGVAVRSLALSSASVSLSTFRLMVVLDELGHSTAERIAQVLRMDRVSVTRQADRLVASGHLVRHTHPYNRTVVTLELTPAGRSLVLRVMHWRHQELTRILDRLALDQRPAVLAAMRAFVDAAAGSGYGSDHITDPVRT